MRSVNITVSISVVAAAVGLAAFGAISASASTSATVVPAVSSGGQSFYTDAQIDQEWAVVTSSFPEALPAGKSWPQTAPSFFERGDGKTHLYETGLPDAIASTYWKCAWLDVSMHAKTVGTNSLSASANKFRDFSSLPGIKGNASFADFDQKMDALAKNTGTTRAEAEFTSDCGSAIYDPNGAVS